MATMDTPESIAQTRTVTAEAVLQHRADLRGYPFHHLAVVAHRGIGGQQLTAAIAAADTLATIGWELITISEFTSSHIVYAFMRRSSPPPHWASEPPQ